jgi:hypothetical protein
MRQERAPAQDHHTGCDFAMMEREVEQRQYKRPSAAHLHPVCGGHHTPLGGPTLKVPINADREAKQLAIPLADRDWEAVQQRDCYQGAQQLPQVIPPIGPGLARQFRAGKVTSVPTLYQAGQVWYRTAASGGRSLTLHGPIAVRRPPSQTGAGGETSCPLGAGCQRALGAATPLPAGIVRFDLSALPAREVQRALAKPRGRGLSASSRRQPAPRVGQVAVGQAPAWRLSEPGPAPDVARVAAGLDGTTMPLVGGAYKGARCGTIALGNDTGARLTAESLGARPEAGQATSTELFTARASAVLARSPQALHVVPAAGALRDWQLLGARYPEAGGGPDFSPAAQPLAAAAALPCGAAPGAQRTAWYERWRAALREDLGGGAKGIRTLISHRTRLPRSQAAARARDTEPQYFRRNAAKRPSALDRAAGRPLGSGVAEAGGKELLKARFGRSGMRGERETATPLLHLRAMRLSTHWDCVWKKVLRYAA